VLCGLSGADSADLGVLFTWKFLARVPCARTSHCPSISALTCSSPPAAALKLFFKPPTFESLNTSLLHRLLFTPGLFFSPSQSSSYSSSSSLPNHLIVAFAFPCLGFLWPTSLKMQAIHMYGLTVPPDGIPIKGHAGVNATVSRVLPACVLACIAIKSYFLALLRPQHASPCRAF
jgi:hypothetical protein